MAKPARKQLLPGVVVFLALIALAVTTPNDTQSAESKGGNTFAATVAPKSESGFQQLVGRWLRQDGGYVIEIRHVADTGTLDAVYLNPKPIHVAKAEASWEGSTMQVFVELRDVNYPGSTYTLQYYPATDQLKGIYYQAVARQQYEIVFERLK